MGRFERHPSHGRVCLRQADDLRKHHVRSYFPPESLKLTPHRNYDIFGASSTAPGPNAPLGDLCGTSSQPQYNAKAAVKRWTAAKFPASQLMLGLPLYGYVSQSTKTTLSDGKLQHTNGTALDAYRAEVLGLAGKSYAVAEVPENLDETDSAAELNPLGGAHPHVPTVQEQGGLTALASGDLSSFYGQQIAFRDLVAQGALKETSSGTFTGNNGYTYSAYSVVWRAFRRLILLHRLG